MKLKREVMFPLQEEDRRVDINGHVCDVIYKL